MAVEPPHLNLFSPQILSNRDMIDEGNRNVYGFGIGHQMDTTGMLPMYVNVSSGLMDAVPNLKADSGLTYSLPISRKRSRDSASFDPSVLSFSNAQFVNLNQLNNQKLGSFAFLGQDISMQIYQQQVEIDRFIAHHMEKVRAEMEATRRRNSVRLIAAAEEGIKKRLRLKEEEIVQIGKLNCALEEKVKSLSAENQLWQQMAETNEATANALRSNLQRILFQQQNQNENENQRGIADKSTVDDVESCCGSNYDEAIGGRKGVINNKTGGNQGNDFDAYCTTSSDINGSRLNRWCRNCGKEESCVLLLPCRHLCICTVCESSINFCPICKSSKNATLPVNIT